MKMRYRIPWSTGETLYHLQGIESHDVIGLDKLSIIHDVNSLGSKSVIFKSEYLTTPPFLKTEEEYEYLMRYYRKTPPRVSTVVLNIWIIGEKRPRELEIRESCEQYTEATIQERNWQLLINKFPRSHLAVIVKAANGQKSETNENENIIIIGKEK